MADSYRIGLEKRIDAIALAFGVVLRETFVLHDRWSSVSRPDQVLDLRVGGKPPGAEFAADAAVFEDELALIRQDAMPSVAYRGQSFVGGDIQIVFDALAMARIEWLARTIMMVARFSAERWR
ncbi:hypothetical protein HHA01_22250 [Halomonas halmophila]|uniref:Uncharacterized protein n=1 Tax=Halomonas halmophila TaxID=252 RepID=A0A4Y4F800_9GAMM|nr:hypothetical protein [Halomonas halmophila]GED23248.1 hypothetical protein HHA01_22250 [Halomonas halmophila]